MARRKRTSWLQIIKLAGVLTVGVIACTGMALIDTTQPQATSKR